MGFSLEYSSLYHTLTILIQNELRTSKIGCYRISLKDGGIGYEHLYCLHFIGKLLKDYTAVILKKILAVYEHEGHLK